MENKLDRKTLSKRVPLRIEDFPENDVSWKIISTRHDLAGKGEFIHKFASRIFWSGVISQLHRWSLDSVREIADLIPWHSVILEKKFRPEFEEFSEFFDFSRLAWYSFSKDVILKNIDRINWKIASSASFYNALSLENIEHLLETNPSYSPMDFLSCPEFSEELAMSAIEKASNSTYPGDSPELNAAHVLHFFKHLTEDMVLEIATKYNLHKELIINAVLSNPTVRKEDWNSWNRLHLFLEV